MANGKRTVVGYRRKRTDYTNYKTRLTLLKSGKHRLVVRRSMKYVLGQLVDYSPEGDKVLITVSSRELSKMGWKYSFKNIPAAYLAGLLLGVRAKQNKLADEAVVDIGDFVSKKESRLYAFVKGAKDAGLSIPISEDVLPSDERVSGAHISKIESSVKSESQFSGYKKSKSDTSKIKEEFEKIKAKING